MTYKSTITKGFTTDEDGKNPRAAFFIEGKEKERMTFVKMFKKGLEVLIADPNLQGNDIRVFLMVCCLSKYENLFDYSQRELAEKLNMDYSAVTRVVRKLVELGYLHKDRKIGTLQTYRINPDICYKGQAKNRRHLKILTDANKEYGTPISG